MLKITHLFILFLSIALSSSTMNGEDLEAEVTSLDIESINSLEAGFDELEANIQKIFIDPGHGGTDPGAIGNGVGEAKKNLEIALKLGKILESKGYRVKYSRTSNSSVSLSQRAAGANNWGADLFVSIHCNSFPSSSTYGTEVFLHPNGGQVSLDYAKKISKALSSKMGLFNRGAKTADYVVLRETSMPAVLVETAFVSNSKDAKKLNSNPQGFADAIGSVF